jgi:single-stranded-DNA-specific exonuclease
VEGAAARRRWIEVPCDEAAAARLSRELGLHPLAARVLQARGLGDPAQAERFLAARLSDLPDPFAMRGMATAVERVARAIDAGERIALYGDYDVDGVTSTALLAGFLRAAGADLVTYVPHRLVEGYGLNVAAVRRLAADGARLLVALDCGITSVEEVAAAAALGVDTVVVDHHTVPVELPAAAAILNPHQPGCGYPFPHLAAVGVTFCLCMALRRRLREAGRFGAARPEPNLKEALDLVALGTVADVVPLTGPNRILVRWGLEAIARTRRPGLRALKQVAGVADGPVTAGQIGFRLGPRINAAGRLDDASRGVRLLLTADAAEAGRLAEELDRENRERQEIERRILAEALADGAERVAAGARGLVLAREGWHPGVVGIVASRVVERFHRPAVLVALGDDGAGKGSGRSIEGFHLYDALAACSAHLSRFGGHRHAAGVTIDPAAVPAFRAAFERHAAERLGDDDLVPRCRIEGWLDRGAAAAAAPALERLAPFGAGHPEPIFALRARPTSARTVGAAGAHLRLSLGDGLDAIGFGMGRSAALCDAEVEAAVTIGFDDWGGARRVQLKLRDLRAA